MHISLRSLLAATLLVTVSITPGYTAEEYGTTGEIVRRTFKFTTHAEETRAHDWAEQIVTFCKPVLRGQSVSDALNTMGVTLFTRYSALSLERQDNIAGNVPRAYSALDKIDNIVEQLDYIKALYLRHVRMFERSKESTTDTQ
jgi:hypothetical protein